MFWKVKEWISEWWVLIMIALAILAVGLAILWGFAVENRDYAICVDAGYVGKDTLDGRAICYGYVEGNQMIVVDFERVRGND